MAHLFSKTSSARTAAKVLTNRNSVINSYKAQFTSMGKKAHSLKSTIIQNLMKGSIYNKKLKK